MKNKNKIKPIDTAEKLWKVMMGLVGVNLAFDDKNGEPNKDVIKARSANFGLVRHGVIASDFIVLKGLEKEYAKYQSNVDIQVLKIRNKVAEEGE